MSESTNRYANDWNTYSAAWDEHWASKYRHLGDEWCDDGTGARQWEQRLFNHSFAPWFSPDARVLEIGPGGGKWTVQIAPKVASLTVFDVAEAMLERTRARCADADLSNVSFVHGNGRDMSPIADASLDVVFSYDVFVHIALEDTVAYLQEFTRVLRDGGVVLLHHAVNDVPAAQDRIESHNDWYRDRANTLGQYYYYSHAALERMYARAGLRIRSMWTDYCTVVVTAEKPVDSLAPRLEQHLRLAATAGDAETLDHAVQSIAAIEREMEQRLATLLATVKKSRPGQERYAAIQAVRRLMRG